MDLQVLDQQAEERKWMEEQERRRSEAFGKLQPPIMVKKFVALFKIAFWYFFRKKWITGYIHHFAEILQSDSFQL